MNILTPQLILQLIGGLIAFIASLFAIFYKDTINKQTHKLTGWGFASLSLLLIGNAVSGLAKYAEYEDKQRKDAIAIHVQDSIMIEQNAHYKHQIDSLSIIIGKIESFRRLAKDDFGKVDLSLNKSIEELKLTSNSLNRLSPLEVKLQFVYNEMGLARELLKRLDAAGNGNAATLSSHTIDSIITFTTDTVAYFFHNTYYFECQFGFVNPDDYSQLLVYPASAKKSLTYKVVTDGYQRKLYVIIDYIADGQLKPLQNIDVNAARIHGFDFLVFQTIPIKYFDIYGNSGRYQYINVPTLADPIKIKFPDKEWRSIDLSDEVPYNNKTDKEDKRVEVTENIFLKKIAKQIMHQPPSDKPDTTIMFRIHNWDYVPPMD